MRIVFGDFAKKNCKFDLSKSKECEKDFIYSLETEVSRAWDNREEGYRDGVWLVPLKPSDWPEIRCPIVQLSEGDYLLGQFKKRNKGEAPRKNIQALNGKRLPTRFINIVVYERYVLEEDKPVEHNCDAEIITVLAQPVKDQPMPPETLIANHYKLSGGTSTKMSAEEFEENLRISVDFWKDKAILKQ